MYISKQWEEFYPNYREAIATPLKPEDVEWKQQSSKKDDKTQKWKHTIVPYITARYMYKVLQDVFGPGNYKINVDVKTVGTTNYHFDTEYKHNKKERSAKAVIVEPRYAGIATISIRIPGTSNPIEWVEFQDGSEDTDVEPYKGCVSNSVKRTMVQLFPPITELYNYPKCQVVSDSYDFYISDYEKMFANVTLLYQQGKVTTLDWLKIEKDCVYKGGKKVSPTGAIKNDNVEKDEKTETKNVVVEKKAMSAIGVELRIEGDGKHAFGIVKQYEQKMKDELLDWAKNNSRKFIFEAYYQGSIMYFAQMGDTIVCIDERELLFLRDKVFFKVLHAAIVTPMMDKVKGKEVTITAYGFEANGEVRLYVSNCAITGTTAVRVKGKTGTLLFAKGQGCVYMIGDEALAVKNGWTVIDGKMTIVNKE